MLKKIFLGLLLITSSVLSAQNVQLHYVPRHAFDSDGFSQNLALTTVEMFKPDAWGSTFMFIDMTYDAAKGGIGSAYWEIARDLRFWECPIAAHIEYNGGVVDGVSGAIPNAYLLGASYPFKLGNAFMSTYLAYKYHAFAKHSDDVQWTLTWNVNFLDNQLSFGGFLDIWTENKDRSGISGSSKKTVILAQPQLWYNFTGNFALGTEIEISDNFRLDNQFETKFHIFPTLAAKWSF